MNRRSLDQMLKPDQKVKVFYGVSNPNNELRHIKAIVDDEYIVYKTWNNRRQSWRYRIDHRYDFEYKYENGVLS